MLRRHGLYGRLCSEQEARTLIDEGQALGMSYDVLERITLTLEVEPDIIRLPIPDPMTADDCARITAMILDAGFERSLLNPVGIALSADIPEVTT